VAVDAGQQGLEAAMLALVRLRLERRYVHQRFAGFAAEDRGVELLSISAEVQVPAKPIRD
jgi:hypothetical protein